MLICYGCIYLFIIFTVVSVKLEESSSIEHQLFIKAHQTRESDPNKPNDRTLFVLNVPPFIYEVSLLHRCYTLYMILLFINILMR